MRFLGWIITLPLLLLLIAFALENRQSVTLDFFLFDFQATLPLSLLALGLLLIGFILGSVTSWLGSLSLRFNLHRLRREKDGLAEELAKRPPLPEIPKKGFLCRLRHPFSPTAGDQA